MRGRSPRHRLTRQGQLAWLAALLALSIAGCSSASGTPHPSASTASLTPTPTPSPSNDPKPGGTLRIAGVTRSVVLDPASPVSDPTAAAGTATSAADANRLIGRLVLRQLYGYAAVDPTDAVQGKQDQATGPKPDLAAGAPKLTDGGRTATITLRTARWDVPSSRRVTAADQLRALKRLCLPTVNSPVSGYLAESVVGYAAACQSLAAHPPATLAALDAIIISGLTTEGDTALVIHLIRPTNDLTAILSLPQTSPLPIESFSGLQVTNDPQAFVGDGPYRFIDPQNGETYALSRNPSWDPSGDPLRHAYVDHISVRGGLTASQVQQRVRTGSADLSLDVPVASTVAARAKADEIVRTPDQGSLVLAVGSKGANARRLRLPAVRSVLAACVDTATRARVAAALGSGVTKPSDELLSGLSLVPAGQPSPSAEASSTATPNPSASATPDSSAAATGAPSSTVSPSGSVAASSSPAVRCAPTRGVTGVTVSLLIADSKPLRAAAAVIISRLRAAGVHVALEVADARRYDAYARLGGWDLLLSVRPMRYPAPRALLAPLLDARWRGVDAVALLRSPTFVAAIDAAVAARESDASIALWDKLQAGLTQTESLLPLADIDAVYPRGPNVAHAPTVPTFGNADPANVALGSTRPSEPARTASSTP